MVGSRPGRPITISAPSQAAAAKIQNFHLKKNHQNIHQNKDICMFTKNGRAQIFLLFTKRITFLQSELSTYKYGAYMPLAECL